MTRLNLSSVDSVPRIEIKIAIPIPILETGTGTRIEMNYRKLFVYQILCQFY